MRVSKKDPRLFIGSFLCLSESHITVSFPEPIIPQFRLWVVMGGALNMESLSHISP